MCRHAPRRAITQGGAWIDRRCSDLNDVADLEAAQQLGAALDGRILGQAGHAHDGERAVCFFFFKQKTAYEITYGDWSSDVCSSDLRERPRAGRVARAPAPVARLVR